MLSALPWLALATLLALGVMAAALWVLARQRSCPSCQADLEIVAGSEPDHAYEILLCPTCDTAATLAGGQRVRFSWCPRCRQRALDLDLSREGSTLRVAERCELCGHRGDRVVSMPDDERPPRGIVVPFPDASA